MEVQNRLLYEFGPFTLDPSQMLVFRDGAALPLTLKAVEVLLILVENSDRLVTKETLMEKVWPESFVEAGNLTQTVSVLRKQLEDDSQTPRYIKTFPRRGYQFVGSVKQLQQKEVELEEHTRATISIQEKPIEPPRGVRRNWRRLLPATPGAATLMLASSVAGLFLLTWFLTHSRQASANLDQVRYRQFVAEAELDASTLFDARFSPDGTLVAYSHTGDGQNIWVKQLSGGDAHRVTNGSWRDRSPVWSPDGQRIAFVSNRGGQNGIWTVNFLGGSETLIKTVGDSASEAQGGPPMLVKWSADGGKIYYEWNFNLFSLGVKDGNQELLQLTHFDGTREMPQAFALSPDESRVAFQGQEGNIWQMVLREGKPTRVTTDGLTNRNPVWHQDGRHIFYDSIRDGITKIFYVDRDGGTPIQVTAGVVGEMLADVNVGKEGVLTFSQRETSHLFSMDLASGIETQLTDSVGEEFWPVPSPDGARLAYHSLESDSAIWDPRAGNVFLRRLPNSEQPARLADKAFNIEWAPDGKRIAFLRYSRPSYSLWTLSIDGGKEQQIIPEGLYFGGQAGGIRHEKVQVKDLDWAPDSTRLSFVMRDNGIMNAYTIAGDGGEKIKISENTDSKRRVFSPIWAPSGTAVAYVIDSGRMPGTDGQYWELFSWSQNGIRKVFRSSKFVRLLGWDSDENMVVALVPADDPNRTSAKNVDLIRISTSTLDQNSLTKLSSTFLLSIKISPSRRNISFISSQGNRENVFAWSFAPRQISQLTANSDPKVHLANVTWSPDEKTVYFAKATSWSFLKLVENLALK